MAGPDELREVAKLLSSYSTTFHLMANHTCEIEGALATGEVYRLAHHHRGGRGGDNTLMVIRYRDRYAKLDGAWRFARRDVMRQDRAPRRGASAARGLDGARGRRRGRHRGGLGNGTRHGSRGSRARHASAVSRRRRGRDDRREIAGNGGEAHALEADVSSAAIGGVAASTEELVGNVLLLANIAGVQPQGDTVLEQDEAGWDRILGVNLKGVWLGMRALLPGMCWNAARDAS